MGFSVGKLSQTYSNWFPSGIKAYTGITKEKTKGGENMSIDERKIGEFIYELPQESDIEGMEWEHICVNIADIFPNKFYDISYSYVRKLEEVLVHYDVVIFMARKAICFFKALLLNGVITNEYLAKFIPVGFFLIMYGMSYRGKSSFGR